VAAGHEEGSGGGGSQGGAGSVAPVFLSVLELCYGEEEEKKHTSGPG
jgi:hypothetical protein